MEETSEINRDVKEFLSKNKIRYEIFENFQDYLNRLNEDSYRETIQYVEDHKDIFFKDHANALFFLVAIICLSESNFKRFEIYMDIIVHFSNELDKQNLTKKESIAICILYPNTINYLFSKNFFKIETIVELSSGFKFLFANFYHEIVDYDPEYAFLIERKLLSDENYTSDEEEVNFLNYVKNNRKEHFLNRELNYHPSSLHKSIRDDDIYVFQSLLSQNNYNINHAIENSIYERFKNDTNLSLIEIASVYGSIKVFKFLWMQENIYISDNLLKYAYIGCNHEIIHICETKCKRCHAYIVPITQHKYELFEYFIENYGDEIEEDEDEDVKNKLKSFIENDKDENIYKNLNVECLIEILSSLNLKMLKFLLPKIVFIMKNCQYTNPKVLLTSKEPFLNSSSYDLELFKFFYYQEKKKFDVNTSLYSDITTIPIYINANDILKFLINEVKNDLDIFSILFTCTRVDHECANYILDLKNEIPDLFVFNINLLSNAIWHYNEDIVVKMIKLHNVFDKEENISIISNDLKENISTRMIVSLYKRLSSFLPKDKLAYFASLFDFNLENNK